MPHVVEVGPQVDVDDSRLALDDSLGDPLHRLMGCPPRPVAKRPRLEVSLKDRFQDELERPLDHAVADSRDAQDADLAVAFGYLLPPVPHRTIPAVRQFVPELPQELPHATCFDGLEGDPVDARGPVVLLGQEVRLVKGLLLADVDVQAPEAPGRVGLRLGADLPPQVLQIDGRLDHPAPASRVVGRVTNSRAPSLRGHYPASALLRAPPSPSRRQPTSRCYRLYGLPSFRRFRSGRGGLLQLLDASWSSCRR